MVGNYYSRDQVYLNRRTADPAAALQDPPDWSSNEVGPTSDVAVGDPDNDGALDLVVADFGRDESIKVYMNQGGSLQGSTTYTLTTTNAYSVALGDMDRDGYLDLAVGTSGGPKLVYPNKDGRLQPAPVWTSSDADWKSVVAWGDANGDGYTDLAAGNAAYGWGASPNKVYLNLRGTLDAGASWSSESIDETSRYPWGSYPAGITPTQWPGAMRTATGSSTWPWRNGLPFADDNKLMQSADKLYLNRGLGTAGSPTGATNVSISLSGDPASTYAPADEPDSTRYSTALAPADYYSTASIRSGGIISLTYTLTNTVGVPIRFLRGFYSSDGGGSWRPAYTAAPTRLSQRR